MPLSTDDKIALVKKYAPILFFHPEEKFVPIAPEAYISLSALWSGQPPDDKKENWGKNEPGYPRKPLIPKKGISLNPSHDFEGTSDPDKDGVNEWYLGHKDRRGTSPYLVSNNERELWLDFAGWKDTQDVTSGSSNTLCNVGFSLEKMKNEWKFTPPRGIYYAEVEELDSTSKLLLSLNSPIDYQKIQGTLGDTWIIWYYFFYPIHEEYLQRCEEIFDESSDGNYEGDWNAIAVIIKKPLDLPWESNSYPFPEYVAYGIRLRGLAKEFFPDLLRQGWIIRHWNEVHKYETHARVYIAKGYHNNYSLPGTHNPIESELFGIPLSKFLCGGVEGVDKVVTEITDTWEDIKEVGKDIGVTLAKLIAGSGIGGSLFGPAGALIGALAGGLAGLAEALSSSSDSNNTLDPEVRKKLEQEHAPEDKKYGFVLTPSDVPNPLITESPNPDENETAVLIKYWENSESPLIVDRESQIWWPNKGEGYNGRWGVRCQNDPLDRRSGITFPNFRETLLNDFVVHITKSS